jgi:hypothetical protein
MCCSARPPLAAIGESYVPGKRNIRLREIEGASKGPPMGSSRVGSGEGPVSRSEIGLGASGMGHGGELTRSKRASA